MNSQEIEKLKSLIQAELKFCDSLNTPTVCAMSSNPDNYILLEKMIIDKIAYMGLTVGAAIVEIEREYNPNIID